jgi:LacI family transcriptional regulator
LVAKGRVTMAQVAQQSGVSLSTVSLVLRDRPGVGPGTRRRVLKSAKDLGYIPKRPTAPYTADLTNIGMILKAEPDRVPEANKFYSRVVAGIETACRRMGTNLFYASMTVDEDSHPLELPRILVEQDSADGLLLLGVYLNEALNPVIDRRTTPIILVDAYATSGAHDAVVSDNVAGACEAVTYLISHGHRHIAFVGSHPKAHPSIQERQRGYERALGDHGITDRYSAECHIANNGEVIAATTSLLHESPEITAVFGANDDVAIGVIDAAHGMGLKVPDDLSVVGFDNIDLAERVSPSLTTMHVDKVGMGRLAVQLLVNRVEHPQSTPVRAVVCPRLIERGSVRTI